jgi:protease I
MSDIVRRVVKEFAYRSKIIAAICHGPQVLISANVGKSKLMTGFDGIHDDIANYCGNRPPHNERVVHDDNFGYDLITAQHYKDNPEFMKKILDVYYNQYVPRTYQG